MKGSGIINKHIKLTPHGIVGSALLHSITRHDKPKYIIKHIRDKLKTHKHHVEKGAKVNEEYIKKFIAKYKNRTMHIKDILGDDWHSKSKEIHEELSDQSGSGIFKTLKNITKKGLKTLKRFIRGETRIKPSHLAKVIGIGADIAKMGLAIDPRTKAFVPVADVVGKIAKYGEKELKKHGRGQSAGSLKLSGQGADQSAGSLKLSGQGAMQSAAGVSLSGGKSSDKLPYGVKMSGGKIVRDRYSVYHGYHPKTRSGLTKNDFMLKGKKVISKKKHMNGKRIAQSGKGIFKN